jgi:hypothetical protein
VQYALRKPSAEELEELENLPSGGMNAKTALLAGIIVGVSLMVGLVGFLAWREKQAEEAEKNTPPAAVVDAGTNEKASPPKPK